MGVHPKVVQELLGHKDVTTTMLYTHVLGCGYGAVRSPVDRLFPASSVLDRALRRETLHREVLDRQTARPNLDRARWQATTDAVPYGILALITAGTVVLLAQPSRVAARPQAPQGSTPSLR